MLTVEEEVKKEVAEENRSLHIPLSEKPSFNRRPPHQ
jgi:hypothetical protein